VASNRQQAFLSGTLGYELSIVSVSQRVPSLEGLIVQSQITEWQPSTGLLVWSRIIRRGGPRREGFGPSVVRCPQQSLSAWDCGDFL
jgi:hypothetical protein